MGGEASGGEGVRGVGLEQRSPPPCHMKHEESRKQYSSMVSATFIHSISNLDETCAQPGHFLFRPRSLACGDPLDPVFSPVNRQQLRKLLLLPGTTVSCNHSSRFRPKTSCLYHWINK